MRYVSRFRGGIVGERGQRSVRWSGGFFWVGRGCCFFLGVGLRGGGAPVVSIAIRPAAVHSMFLISIF